MSEDPEIPIAHLAAGLLSKEEAEEEKTVHCGMELVHRLNQWITPMPSDLFEYLFDIQEKPKGRRKITP
ncbi:MAG: hypothetical protein AAFQ10_10740 [Pseudomonadota bacterium]